FFFSSSVTHRYLHSFPTRRSSDLKVWQDARVFVKLNYELTDSENFKKDYGLKDQLQRSVVSIMNNIAEGFDGNREFIKFLKYSKDRKSTRLNSSHVKISYAVFCLK